MDHITCISGSVRHAPVTERRGFDDLHNDIHGMTEKLGSVIKWQISLNKYLHSLATFTVKDRETIVPRFLYLTNSKKEKSTWTPLNVFSQEVHLHFLYETRYDDLKMHEVEGQLDVLVRYTKEWARKVAPVLDLTLKIAIVAAKVANNIVLPGLNFVPDFTIVTKALGNAGQIAGGLGDFLSDISKSCFESNGKNLQLSRAYTAEAQKARMPALRYVKAEVVGKLSDGEFEQQVGLRRVRILDASGHIRRVGWICRACREKFGTLAIDMLVDIN